MRIASRITANQVPGWPPHQAGVERTEFFRVVAKDANVHAKKDQLENVRLLYAPRERILYQRLPVEVMQ